MTGVRITWTDNTRDFRRDLDDAGRRVFPQVMAKSMNNAIYAVKGALETHIAKTVDRPNAFTRKAWVYTKAKAEDGDKMFAEVRARPKQAQYLWLLISGGERKPGDAATNPKFHDMFSWAAKLTQYGGADRREIKRIVKRVAAEKKRRALYAEKRKTVLAQHLKPEVQARRLAKLRWAVVSKGAPGVFLGTIGGVRGYWERSERFVKEDRDAALADSRANGKFRKERTTRLSWTKPGSRPKLLVALSRETTYKGIFDYNKVVNQSFAEQMSPEKLKASLNYYLGKK